MVVETVSSRGVARENRERRYREKQVSATVTERVIVLYPYTSKKLIVKAYGPINHVITISEQGFPHSVASLQITQKQGKAPFHAEIIIVAGPDATPGVYPWRLRILDTTMGKVLGEEPITLIILSKDITPNIAKYATKLRKIYEKYGIQIALWATLKTLYPGGASFSTVWALYRFLTSNKVSKGTVGNTLSVMISKRLLDKLSNGLYRALDLDPETALSRVDIRRVRYPWQVLKQKPMEKGSERKHGVLEEYRFSLDKLPKPIQRAYHYAREIAHKHGPLTGFYFILYSLLGVRQTGYLLLWLNGWFITLEQKTGFCHHFYSWILHYLLQRLGLREGIYYYLNNLEHEEARKTAQQYIRKYYGSHQNARRLHYMLREEGLVWNDNEVYTIRIHHYMDGSIGIEIFDAAGKELLYSEGIQDEISIVETRTALPYQHIDEDNEETYFYRPSGLY